VLVVEDGDEYAEAFRRLAGAADDVEFLSAHDAAAALEVLGARAVDAVFLDVVFDRIPPERLVGDAPDLTARFGGDRARVLDHLARHQGFYLARALAPRLPPGARVVLAQDFGAEPARLDALRETVPALEGVADGTPISEVLLRLRA
jgi:CheY-like chemotaxis protein